MCDPLVSVIIPCYNGEEFIERSIESVYCQNWPHIHLIVVDDGSTDSSGSKIQSWASSFAEKGFELRYIYQKNQGPAAAINAGLKYVKGTFLSLLDADDLYLPECIRERCQYLLNNPDIEMVRSNGYMVRGGVTNEKWLFVQEEKEKNTSDLFGMLVRGETNNWAGSYMLRMCALDAFYPAREIYPSRFGQNLQLMLPIAYRNRCGFLDRPHMYYILQPQSLSQTQDESCKKTRAIQNANGYLDIRLHMVNAIVQNDGERKQSENQAYGCHWQRIMQIALQHKDKSLMRTAYRELKAIRNPTIDDEIHYYSLMSKICWFLLRLKRKAIASVKSKE